MTEEWRVIPGFQDRYEVSDQGRLRSWVYPGGSRRSAPRLRALSATTRGGYLQVSLKRDGRARTYRIHRLVLLAFVGPRPTGLQARHLDGNGGNNTLANLRYGTGSENTLDKVLHGTHNCARKTHCKNGHELTEENIYRHKSGARDCRTCRSEANRRHRQRAA